MKNILTTMFALLVFTIGGVATAQPSIGKQLPFISIDDKGQMQVSGDEVTFKSFSSADFQGKVTTLLVIAARDSAAKKNEAFQDELKKAAYSPAKHNVVSIIGLNQAIFGTKGIALGRSKDKKLASPTAQIVIDAGGVAVKAWGLSKKSYAVIILDQQGRVVRFKDGAMSEAEMADFIAAIGATL